jgi:hypothetical protein
VKELTILSISITSVSGNHSRKKNKTGLAGPADITGEDKIYNKQNYADSNTISWDGNNDPGNSKNCPEYTKWGMVVSLPFITSLT